MMAVRMMMAMRMVGAVGRRWRLGNAAAVGEHGWGAGSRTRTAGEDACAVGAHAVGAHGAVLIAADVATLALGAAVA